MRVSSEYFPRSRAERNRVRRGTKEPGRPKSLGSIQFRNVTSAIMTHKRTSVPYTIMYTRAVGAHFAGRPRPLSRDNTSRVSLIFIIRINLNTKSALVRLSVNFLPPLLLSPPRSTLSAVLTVVRFRNLAYLLTVVCTTRCSGAKLDEGGHGTWKFVRRKQGDECRVALKHHNEYGKCLHSNAIPYHVKVMTLAEQGSAGMSKLFDSRYSYVHKEPQILWYRFAYKPTYSKHCYHHQVTHLSAIIKYIFIYLF